MIGTLRADSWVMQTRSLATRTQDEAMAIAEALGRGDADVIRVMRDWQKDNHVGVTNRSEARVRALIEVAAAVAAVHHLDEVLELVAEHSLVATGAASVSISRWNVSGATVQTLINVGDLAPGEERRPADEVHRVADLPLWSALLSGVPLLLAVEDPALDPAYRDLLHGLGKESAIAVAIRSPGEVWGELWATTAPGQPRFSGDDVVFLQTIARQIGAAIARAELFDQIAALAFTDPLTSVGNRRALEEALDRALSTARDEVALIVCDVDGLKCINDQLGHAAGDEVIVRVSEALSHAANGHERAMVSRIGGDEFCVMLPLGGLDAARAVSSDAIRTLRRLDPPVRIACGAAAARGGSANALLRAADAAQYTAKRLGSDVLQIAQTHDAPRSPCADIGRRSRRDAASRQRQLLVEALDVLDSKLVNASPEDRLAAVAERVMVAHDATSWSIGFAPERETRMNTIRTSAGGEIALPDGALDHPSGFVILAGQQTGPIQGSLLRTHGLAACVGLATPTPQGTWVTVLFSERPVAEPSEFLAELRLLALAATAV